MSVLNRRSIIHSVSGSASAGALHFAASAFSFHSVRRGWPSNSLASGVEIACGFRGETSSRHSFFVRCYHLRVGWEASLRRIGSVWTRDGIYIYKVDKFQGLKQFNIFPSALLILLILSRELFRRVKCIRVQISLEKVLCCFSDNPPILENAEVFSLR